MNVTLTMEHTEGMPAGKAPHYAPNLVETMGDASFAPMPLKPSATMLAAGARAGNVTVETVWKIYQAMLREGA